MAGGKILFTHASVVALVPPQQGRDTWLDERVPGLQLRITSNGIKTWSWYRRIPGGQPERVTLGRWPAMSIDDARRHAIRLNAAATDGENPAQMRRDARQEITFADLFATYMERWAKPRKKTWQDDEAYFRLHLAEDMGKKKLSSITRREIALIHVKIGEKHPTMANRVIALISSVFGRAKEWGIWEGENPCLGVRRYQEESRTRFLSNEEIERFLTSILEESESTRAFFLLSLLTGARRENVQAMRWDQIDLEQQVWRIPATKNTRGKPRPLTVPLVPMAADILTNLQGNGPLSEWVFPSPRSTTGHLVEPRKAWERILARAEIEDARIHDLRRTMGSWQAITGASLPVIGKSLGHYSQQSTAIYARLNLDPVRKSMEKAAQAMIGKTS
ncbi:MAG: tyrosine-type recombinase/integrase [Magnetococcales bacterium]|nr:tyrosine-type recombinase/integrase [Magnetococcales bacterium]NGZ25418.1 tyrosine-type recombinase/integrase [Magnetococcales bacterium]